MKIKLFKKLVTSFLSILMVLFTVSSAYALETTVAPKVLEPTNVVVLAGD